MRSTLAALALAPFVVTFACNRGGAAPDAGPAATATTTAAPTQTAPATDTTTVAPPGSTPLAPLATGTAPRPMIKLPDGGFAPAPLPEGGAFAVPSGLSLPPMPSTFPTTITIPSTITVPSTLPSTLPAWPPPPPK